MKPGETMKKMRPFTEDVYHADAFKILLTYEISRSQRYPCPISLIQIEMTPTAFNEEALKAAPLIFSAVLNTHLRSSDIPSRSGNLFTLLLPNSDRHGAQVVSERLLAIFKNKLEDANGNSVTFSLHIGATTHSGGEDITSEVIFEKAAEALKQSMRKGPNTYVFVL